MRFWTKEEFNKIQPELQKLSLDQLKTLANKTGIAFTDDPGMKKATKDDIILILDETDQDELMQELKKLDKFKISH